MAEETIISDLEQAPLLKDDMVIAVEDTKNTYSATLAQLRELVNKLFVEKKDIDFNTLTDDGFYQVGGTLTNAPVSGSITWIVQVVKVGTVIVQNAMATDATNYTHQYIRRYNGTSWDSWQDTKDNLVHKTGNETIAGDKTFTGNSFFQNKISSSNLIELKSAFGKNDGFIYQSPTSGIFWIGNRYENLPEFLSYINFNTTGRVEVVINNKATERFFNFPTPSIDATGNKGVTADWVNSKIPEYVGKALSPNIDGLIDCSASLVTTSGYTAPANGYISVQTSQNGVTFTLSINGVKVAGAYQYSGDSHGSENKQLFTLIGKGQTATITGGSIQFGVFVPFNE